MYETTHPAAARRPAGEATTGLCVVSLWSSGVGYPVHHAVPKPVNFLVLRPVRRDGRCAAARRMGARRHADPGSPGARRPAERVRGGPWTRGRMCAAARRPRVGGVGAAAQLPASGREPVKSGLPAASRLSRSGNRFIRSSPLSELTCGRAQFVPRHLGPCASVHMRRRTVAAADRVPGAGTSDLLLESRLQAGSAATA